MLWGKSPEKSKRDSFFYLLSNSGTSTSSLATELPRDTHLPLFRSTRVSQRSASSDSRDELAAIDLSDDECFSAAGRPRSMTRRQREQDVWESAITKAVDTADGFIDLQYVSVITYCNPI